MESMKESAANVGATAKAGMVKTKATVQEKMEKMTAHDPLAKEIAEEKKQAKIHEAELNKKEALRHNAHAKQAATAAAAATHGVHQTHGTHEAHGMHPTHGVEETYSAIGTQAPTAAGAHGTHPTTHGTTTYSTTGTESYTTGQPTGRLTEGVVRTETETGRTAPAHNPRVGGGGGGNYTT